MADRPIDKKIVELDLNTVKFNSNAIKAQQQLNTLSDKELSKLGKSIDTISGKFSALGVVATTALATITNKVINLGLEQINKQLDNIRGGFSQYEREMKALMQMQTSLGSGAAEEIKMAMADITEYANLTVYNVADMFDGLGQMVNQGINLDDATVAIKGLGNVAASAGVDTTRFASVMKTAQLQAMSMGYMMLENWRQIQDAGMATQRYKDALLETAYQMGINIDLTEGFDMSLQSGWMTTEVMIATLKKMAEDDSLIKASQMFISFSQVVDAVGEGIHTAWSGVFKNLFGEFEDARQMWTDLGNALIDYTQKPILHLAEIADRFRQLGGMQDIVDGVSNAFKAWTTVMEGVGIGWQKAFGGGDSVEILLKLASGFEEITAKLIPTEEGMKTIIGISEVLFRTLDVGWEIIKLGIDILGGLSVILQPITNVLSDVLNSFKGIFAGVNDSINELDNSIFERAFSAILEGLRLLGDNAWEFIMRIPEALHALYREVEKFTGPLDLDRIFDIGKTSLFLLLLYDMHKVLTSISKIGDAAASVVENVAGAIESFGGVLDSYSGYLNAQKLKTMAISIGILSASLLVLSLIPYEKLANGVIALTAVVGSFILIVKLLDSTEIASSALAITSLGVAVGLLSASVYALSQLDQTAVGTSTIMISMLIGMLTVYAHFANSFKASSSIAILAIAAGVKSLVAVVEDFGAMDVTQAQNGLFGVGALLTGLAAVSRTLNGVDAVKAAISIGLITATLAFSIPILERFTVVDWNGMIKGGLALSALTAAVAITSHSNLDPRGMLSLIAAVGAIWALVPALERLSTLDVNGMLGSTLAISGILVALTSATHALAADSIIDAAAIIVMAGAIYIIAESFSILSAIPFWPMVGAITAIGVALAGLAAGAVLLGPFSPLVAAAGVALVTLGAGMAAIGLSIGLTAISIAGAVLMMVEAANNFQLITMRILGSAEEVATGLGGWAQNIDTIILDLSHILNSGLKFVLQFFVDALVIIHAQGPTLAYEMGLVATLMVGSFVLGVSEGLTTAGPQIITAIANTLVAVILSIETYYVMFTRVGSTLVSSLGNGIEAAAKALGPNVQSWLYNYVVLPAIRTIESLGNMLNELPGSVGNSLIDMSTSMQASFTTDNFDQARRDLVWEYEQGYISAKAFNEANDNLRESEANLAIQFEKTTEEIKKQTESTKEWDISGGLPKTGDISGTTDAFDGLTESVLDLVGGTVDLPAGFEDVAGALLNTGQQASEATPEIARLRSELIAAGKSSEEIEQILAETDMAGTAEENVYEYKKAMEEGLWGMSDDEGLSSAGSGAGSSIGSSIADAMVEEVKSGTQIVYDTLEEAMAAYEQQLKSLEEQTNDYDAAGSSIDTPYFGTEQKPGAIITPNPFDWYTDASGQQWRYDEELGDYTQAPVGAGTTLTPFDNGEKEAAKEEAYDAGKATIEGFNAGLSDADVDGPISEAMTVISGYFPHSPAKKGPFSGKGWTAFSGKALLEGFASGIQNGMPLVESNVKTAMTNMRNLIENVDLTEINPLSPVLTPSLVMPGIPSMNADLYFNQTGVSNPTSNNNAPIQYNIGGSKDSYEIIVNAPDADPEEVAVAVEQRLMKNIDAPGGITSKVVNRISKLEKQKLRSRGG